MPVQMPEPDGLEAATAIWERERASGPHLRIVAMTAHVMHGDQERCLAASVDGYVLKPNNIKELLAVVESMPPKSQRVSDPNQQPQGRRQPELRSPTTPTRDNCASRSFVHGRGWRREVAPLVFHQCIIQRIPAWDIRPGPKHRK